jgi:predicted dehydrogenase
MTTAASPRWGIIGTANIARAAFLPALRAARGVPAAVAGRDLGRTEHYAREHGIERAVAGYQNLIDDPAIDAVYIALPNSLHADWTIRALEAGKPVLCEKPLCGVLADTERVLEAARQTGTLLWEAFVFPFSEQGGQGVDVETWGTLGYAGGPRLPLSCGMRRAYDTFSRLLGTNGQIHVSNPFHPGPDDHVRLYPARGEATQWQSAAAEPSFTAAIRHIDAVVAGTERPRLLAVETSLVTARALHDLAACWQEGPGAIPPG